METVRNISSVKTISLGETARLSEGVAEVLRGIAPTKGKAILFGSRARGTARPDSDWDVLVLLDKDRITPTDHDAVTYPLRELGWQTNQMINPIMFTTRDWESKRFTPFYKNVMKEGVVL